MFPSANHPYYIHIDSAHEEKGEFFFLAISLCRSIELFIFSYF